MRTPLACCLLFFLLVLALPPHFDRASVPAVSPSWKPGAPPKLAPKRAPATGRGLNRLEALEKGLERDDYCGSQAIIPPGEEGRDRQLLYQALARANGKPADPCVGAMLARGREEALGFSSRSQDLGCRLVRALLLTDQWAQGAGASASPQERMDGLEALRQLAEENPGNGFFALLELGALPDSETAAREDAYQRFLRASLFKSPLDSLVGQLAELSWKNATSLLYGAELNSAVGIPDLSRASRAARRFAKAGLYERDFAAWVDQLERRFERSDRMGLAGPWVNLVEDSSLRGIALAGGEFSRGWSPLLFEEAAWRAFFLRRSGFGDPTVWVDLDQPCDTMIERVREILPGLVREQSRFIALREREGS